MFSFYTTIWLYQFSRTSVLKHVLVGNPLSVLVQVSGSADARHGRGLDDAGDEGEDGPPPRAA